MKRVFLVALSCLLWGNVFGQNKISDEAFRYDGQFTGLVKIAIDFRNSYDKVVPTHADTLWLAQWKLKATSLFGERRYNEWRDWYEGSINYYFERDSLKKTQLLYNSYLHFLDSEKARLTRKVLNSLSKTAKDHVLVSSDAVTVYRLPMHSDSEDYITITIYRQDGVELLGGMSAYYEGSFRYLDFSHMVWFFSNPTMQLHELLVDE